MGVGMVTEQTGVAIGLLVVVVMVAAWAVAKGHVASQALELAREAKADAAAARVTAERAAALEALVLEAKKAAEKTAEAAQKIVERVAALEAVVKAFERAQGGG